MRIFIDPSKEGETTAEAAFESDYSIAAFEVDPDDTNFIYVLDSEL